MKNYFNEKFLYDFLSDISKMENLKFFYLNNNVINNNDNLNDSEIEFSDIRNGLEENGFIWSIDNINVI
jgi:hypothetical protein